MPSEVSACPSTAFAVPLAGEPADQAVSALQEEGYEVRVNQAVSAPLSRCRVTEVNGLRGTDDNGVLKDPSRLNAATLDVDCPSHS